MPRQQQEPPKTPRYDVKGIQSTKTWRELAPQEVAATFPSLVAKRPELLNRLSKRGSSYDVQAVQGGAPDQRRTWREANILKSKASTDAAIAQTGIPNMRSMYQWGENYTKGMVFYNAYPKVVESLTKGPLQALINRGSPAVQKAILHAVGVKPGLGAARIVDEMVRGGVKTVIGPGGAPVAAGISKFPALNLGNPLLSAPRRETRSQNWLSESSINLRRTEYSTRIKTPSRWR